MAHGEDRAYFSSPSWLRPAARPFGLPPVNASFSVAFTPQTASRLLSFGLPHWSPSVSAISLRRRSLSVAASALVGFGLPPWSPSDPFARPRADGATTEIDSYLN